MKNSIRTMFVVLAIIMSFVAVQAAQAGTVEGEITAILTNPNMITVDDGNDVYDVYGIKFTYLKNKYDIDLKVNMAVTVEFYEHYCHISDTTKLIACKITVDDDTVALRPCIEE